MDRSLRSRCLKPGLLGPFWRLSWESRLLDFGDAVEVEDSTGRVYFEKKPDQTYLSQVSGESLVRHDSGHWTRHYANGTKAGYDKEGRLIGTHDLNGNNIHLEYAEDGRLLKVSGPANHTLSLIYGPMDRLIRVQSSTGLKAEFHYSFGMLSEVTSDQKPVVSYVYDKNGRLIQILRAASGLEKLDYDTKGRLIDRQWADGANERYEYGPDENRVKITRPGGGTTEQWFDPQKRLRIVKDPMGRETATQLDDFGRPVKIIGPLGDEISFTYDDRGRLKETKDCCGSAARYDYLDATNLVTRASLPDGEELHYDYDAKKNLVQIRQGKEPLVKINYLPDGLIESLTTPDAPTKRFTYYPDGRIKSDSDSSGRTAAYEYDARGNLIQVTEQGRLKTIFEYDAANRLVSRTDPNGAVTRFSYDHQGRHVETVDPSGGIRRYAYDERGRMTSQTDALGETTRYKYDLNGRLVERVTPRGGTWRYEYDPDDRLIGVTNPLGGKTKMEYDTLGRLIKEESPTGQISRREYEKDNSAMNMVLPGGASIRISSDKDGKQVIEGSALPPVAFRYMPDGQISSIEQGKEGSINYTYDANGRLRSLEDLLGNKQLFHYDQAGRKSTVTMPTGLKIAYRYDREGRVVGIKDSLGAQAGMSYDDMGRLTMVKDPEGATSRFAYDLSGNLVKETTSLGGTIMRSYDKAGRLTNIRGASGDELGFSYNPNGRLSAMKNPAGGKIGFTYDAMGNGTEVTDELGATTRREYDRAGRLTAMIDAMGRTVRFEYDAAGFLARKQFSEGGSVTYRYDAGGRLLEADDGKFPVRFSYDQSGRLVMREYPAIKRSLKYSYDKYGRLHTFTDSENRVFTYSYDRLGRLSAVKPEKGSPIKMTYDEMDRLQSRTYPNGLKAFRAYDRMSRVKALVYQDAGGKTLRSFAYEYDADGNPLNIRDSEQGLITLSYDPAGRFLGERSGTRDTRYTYQAGGDRLQRTDSKQGILTYKYNRANQLLKTGDESFKYDRNGNLIERRSAGGLARYDYDQEGRLIRVVLKNGSQVIFGYAPTGERIWREDADGRTWFVTDGQNLLAELDASLNEKSAFFHGPDMDQPLLMWRDGKTYCLHGDRQGTIAAYSDGQGRLAGQYSTDAFGNAITQTGTVQSPLKFTGRYYEPALGLYYFRARWYDPTLGRFISRDPKMEDIREPSWSNRYVYARNAPGRYLDPTGESAWDEMRALIVPRDVDYRPNHPYTDSLQVPNYEEMAEYGFDRTQVDAWLNRVWRYVDNSPRYRELHWHESSRRALVVEKVQNLCWVYRNMADKQKAVTAIERDLEWADPAPSPQKPLNPTRHNSGYQPQPGTPTGFHKTGNALDRQEWRDRAGGNRTVVPGAGPSGGGAPPAFDGTGPRPDNYNNKYLRGRYRPIKEPTFMQKHGTGILMVALNARHMVKCRNEGISAEDCAKRLLVGNIVAGGMITGIKYITPGVGQALIVYAIVSETYDVVTDLREIDRGLYAEYEERKIAEQRKKWLAAQAHRFNEQFRNLENEIKPDLNQKVFNIGETCRLSARLVQETVDDTFNLRAALKKMPSEVEAARYGELEQKATTLYQQIKTEQARIDAWADKARSGMNWLKNESYNCTSKSSVMFVDDMFDNLGGLVKGIQQKADQVAAWGQELKGVRAELMNAQTKLANAQSIKDRIVSDVARMHNRKDFQLSAEKVAAVNQDMFLMIDRYRQRIKSLRHAFADELPPEHQMKIDELQTLLDTYEYKACDLESLESKNQTALHNATDARLDAENRMITLRALHGVDQTYDPEPILSKVSRTSALISDSWAGAQHLPALAQECIKKAAMAALDCDKKPGSIAFWDPFMTTASCVCPPPLVWNDDQTACVEKLRNPCPDGQTPHPSKKKCLSCAEKQADIRESIERDYDARTAKAILKIIRYCKDYGYWKRRVAALEAEFQGMTPCEVKEELFKRYERDKQVKKSHYLDVSSRAVLAKMKSMNCPQYERAKRAYQKPGIDYCQLWMNAVNEDKAKLDREGFLMNAKQFLKNLENRNCPQAGQVRQMIITAQGGSSGQGTVPAYCDHYLQQINAYLKNNYIEGARDTLQFSQDCPWYNEYVELLNGMEDVAPPTPPITVVPPTPANDCPRLRQELYRALSRNDLQGLKTAQGILQRSSSCDWYQSAHSDVSALAKKLHGQGVIKQQCSAIGQQLKNAIQREDLSASKSLLADAGRNNCSFYQKARTLVERLEKKVGFKEQCRRNQESFNQAMRAKNAGRAESILNQSTQCDFCGPGMMALNRLKGDLARARVPAVVGRKINDARQAIMDAGLHMRIQYVGKAPSESQAHTVTKQSPSPNRVVSKESTVTIYAYTQACTKCSDIGSIHYSWNEGSKSWGVGTWFGLGPGIREVPCSNEKLNYCIDECTGRKHCYKYGR